MVHRLFHALLITAMISAPAALSQQPVNLTYEQVWTQTMGRQRLYAKGYASVGYAPDIMTIPDHPFTAARTYTEWDRNGSPDKPIVTTTVTIARDNMGRIHYESSRKPGEVTVLISDPADHIHYRYEISAPAKPHPTGERCTEPLMSQITRPYTAPKPAAVNQAQPVAPPPPVVDLPKDLKADLGNKVLQGTLAYGQQRTHYLAMKTGFKTMLTEQWFSSELGLNLIETSDISGQDKYTIETHDIQLGEPDPNLFALPSGYLLTEQTESCVKLIN